MFSFHKPKVYRSTTGCCICRAKSSSSRFTDSKKYEDDFVECFRLPERRAGEICNACVLLVKRWKKLPEGSERNWRHVVDARAGPGTKSLTKFKSKNKKKLLTVGAAEAVLKLDVQKKKHVYVKSDRAVREQSPGACSDDILGEDFLSDLSGPSLASSLAPSPTPFDNAQPGLLVGAKNRAKAKSPLRCETAGKPRPAEPLELSSFLDLDYWKREQVCCGFIFRGHYGEVMVDPRFLVPCAGCSKKDQLTSSDSSPVDKSARGTSLVLLTEKVGVATTNAVAKSFSDSSSDSGYDESSNQGAAEANHARSGIAVSINPLSEFAMDADQQCHVQSPAN